MTINISPKLVDTIVIPGDCVSEIDPLFNSSIHLGPGLRVQHERIVSEKSGILRIKTTKTTTKAWIESKNEGSYQPSIGDKVICTVIRKTNEAFYCTIVDGDGCDARLDVLNFDGATKRHYPSLKVGASIYTRVISLDPVELSCCAPKGYNAVDWVYSDRVLFGELVSGFIQSIRPGMAKNILLSSNKIMEQMGQVVTYECAIGVNGRIWLHVPENKNLSWMLLQELKSAPLNPTPVYYKKLKRRLREYLLSSNNMDNTMRDDDDDEDEQA
mmetsp:Transcript_2532/g.3667  ORF Transcript_2532/g.3667 Transcript_2532/m.3667 type:complete len:271 (-) Transcript_2532:116-928(-)